MNSRWTAFGTAACSLFASVNLAFAQNENEPAVALPAPVHAVWDTAKAWRETTATRERICLNGLWLWRPGRAADDHPPTQNWGYFKVPGCWPGITDYLQKDSQTVFAHPAWANEPLRNVSAAWYKRTISIPRNWSGRRVALTAEYLNSFAAVFVDGTKRGEIRFPGGELDLTDWVRLGDTHVLSILVVAMPLKGVLLSYTDSNSARQISGNVERRGLCGDLFLVSGPAGPRIASVKVDTSVRKSEIAFDVILDPSSLDQEYTIRGVITQTGRVVKTLTPRTLRKVELAARRVAFAEAWKPDALWDLHTPGNQFDVTLSLAGPDGRTLDTAFPVKFGFREFWIDGRDFYLNGSRIFLSAVPLDNADVGAAASSYAGARESLERLKSIGINFVYTHNYGCQPGSHLGFAEILRAADDVGMLVSLSQPHFSHYEWKSPDADQTNGYARHAAFYTRVAQDHPSVVAYAMSHNATGYEEDMNPDMIDGLQSPRDRWSSNNVKLALRAEAIVHQLDPNRIVYHHASGNLGSMHAINFYPNFAPVQELSDWFEHWSTQGVKPVFTCEYGAPFTWDWTMYRGWFKGKREFGSAAVPWEFCLAEWNSQLMGDRAFQISKAEAQNLRWEAACFRAGQVWRRWDYPHPVGSPTLDDQYPVMALYLKENWRAFRGWGVSAISPWEYGIYWKTRPGLERGRKELPVDWENLQQPGFSPDYIADSFERMDQAYDRSDWVPTAAAEALLRNNGPLLAFIAGKPARFTSQDHLFQPGETVEKQIIIINNSRQTVTGEASWSIEPAAAAKGGKTIHLPTGEQERVPIRITLPPDLAPGRYALTATVRFSNGETQTDSFEIESLPRPGSRPLRGLVALYDPKGETGALLTRLGLPWRSVDTAAKLSPNEILVIGKGALTTNGPAPDLQGVRDGLKVVLFEQTARVLERRLGFRVTEYGLRQVFPRVPDHPALAGLSTDLLRDWRGASTLLPARLDYTLRPRYGPTVDWCDLPVTRLWRCGNQGDTASVLIEKPARGDFLPILDGGYSLQYSPLMEYHDGRGLILFCQMDVTGRSEPDPAADTLARNLLDYAATWKPTPAAVVAYAGDPAGKRHLESAGFVVSEYEGGKPATGGVLVVSPGGGARVTANQPALAGWLQQGGKLLALGLDQTEADTLPGARVKMRTAEHIATYFEPNGFGSVLRGIGPADVHNRDPRPLPLLLTAPLGDGVLAATPDGSTAFCQMLPWQFDPNQAMNIKRTFRRISFTVTRLLANLGAPATCPLLQRFSTAPDPMEKRWLEGLYLDQPEEWDDPYRFFRW